MDFLSFAYLLVLLCFRTTAVVSITDEEDAMTDAEWDMDDEEDEEMLASCPSPIERSDVLVIGCGLAGLFAAARLSYEGVDVKLVEADEICGGRLRSQETNFDDATFTFESAANEMYGRKKGNSFRENPISKLFDGYDLDTINYDPADWDIYMDDGTPFEQMELNRELREWSKRYTGCLEKAGEDWASEYFSGSGTASPDVSATTILEQCNRPSGWEADTPLKESIAHFYLEQENGVELDRFGQASLGEDSFFDFDAIQFFQNDPDGSSALIEDWVDDHLADVPIYYQTAVSRIRYAVGKNVKVVSQSMNGGSPCQQKFRTKRVIVTPSLAVLRDKVTFRPSQPVQNALDTHPIEITIMEKLWIQFEEVFWDNDKAFITVANEQEFGKATMFINMNYFYQGTAQADNNVLLSFVREDMFLALKGSIEGTLNRDQVESHIGDLLNVAAAKGKTNVGWSYDMTNWKDDPKFLGSWEWWPLGKTYEEFFDAIVPLNDKLFFAGAGHCNRYWGFTWGAIVNGATIGGWVADKENGRLTSDEIPASPCSDGDIVTNAEWKAFYQANPFFRP